MVAILTTKKTKPIVVNHVIISSYAALVQRNFAADLFPKKYDNPTSGIMLHFQYYFTEYKTQTSSLILFGTCQEKNSR